MTFIDNGKRRYDVVLAGGGLHAGLCALALLERRPELTIALVERDRHLGGNHTWCFHAGDVLPAGRSFTKDLGEKVWPGYEVRFPHLKRRLEGAYTAVSSAYFSKVVTAAFAKNARSRLSLSTAIERVLPDRLELASGEVIEGNLIVDARGDLGDVPSWRRTAGFQKFFGQEIELTASCGLGVPLLMDATVPQAGGFRFIYVLPWTETRVLVEDTCFGPEPGLDIADSKRAIADYLARNRWQVAKIHREESGVLPMPWTSNFERPEGPPLVAGYRGGWFHPATGYSFPLAVRLACHVAEYASHNNRGGVFGGALTELFAAVRSQARFAEHLNRLLFHLFEPDKMWNVFERFYGLPEDLITRFYALDLTRTDQLRIIGGRPPAGMTLRLGRAMALLRAWA